MTEVKVSTWVRTIVLVLALVNQVITMLGWNPLPWSEEELYTGVSAAVTTGAALWAWWKNNSFTHAAIEGDNVKEQVKAGRKRGA